MVGGGGMGIPHELSCAWRRVVVPTAAGATAEGVPLLGTLHRHYACSAGVCWGVGGGEVVREGVVEVDGRQQMARGVGCWRVWEGQRAPRQGRCRRLRGRMSSGSNVAHTCDRMGAHT